LDEKLKKYKDLKNEFEAARQNLDIKKNAYDV
jgi:hypothetical protein